MSTILDALKKSEQERKLNNIPTLADMPAPEEKLACSARWLLAGILVVLLLLAIAFLSLSRSDENQRTSEATQIVLDNEAVAIEEAANNNLQVNVVSWSDEAKQRFVIIDGKLVREGEFVRPGVKIEQIKPNSVVLLDRGKRLEISP